MKTRKKGYGVLMTITKVLTLGAVITVIPNPVAGKASFLGYPAVSALAPISTGILLLLAGIVCTIRSKKFTGQASVSLQNSNP
ncbi:MAG: hypothetical protein GF418_13675 [Chitinivibrionales bacterium]|nr:hypothetical protein [Chitinivibrionales bacterium]MBD3396670.1 hypothetical protein [Chitinivibrionales bacterium]